MIIARRSFLLAVALAVLVAVPARANTIVPTFSAFTPGVSIEYDAGLAGGELHSGDGFTIYDIGFFGGVFSVPADWTSSIQATGSAFGATALTTPDHPGLTNVNFTYTGLTIQYTGLGTPFSPFIILTTGTVLTSDDFLSRDHGIGNPLVVGDGALGSPFSAPTVVPSIPDGGSTAVLLGSALVAFGMLRRKLSAR